MKKRSIGLAAIFMALMVLLCACGSAGGEQSASSGTSSSGSSSSETASSATTQTTTASEGSTEMSNSKVLVAYFSATGTTKQLAGTIAEVTGGDLYEIVAAEPYTDADLDYTDDSSRTTIEQNDSSSRPAISGSIGNFDEYDVVFVGYPIWWYDAPHIMFTFAESYDFSGKTVIPFCTSGGSDIGTSGSNIAACAGTGTWLNGARMSGSASTSEVSAWVTSLGI